MERTNNKGKEMREMQLITGLMIPFLGTMLRGCNGIFNEKQIE